MRDVTKALRDLQVGVRSIEDVAEEFRTRKWPKSQPVAKDGEGVMAATLTDRDPEPDGAFSEVVQAFYDGIITVDQYEVLARAHMAGNKTMRDAGRTAAT